MAVIILTGSIALIFVGFGYLLIDCLMGGQSTEKPERKTPIVKSDFRKKERTIKILGNDVPIKRGDGIY